LRSRGEGAYLGAVGCQDINSVERSRYADTFLAEPQDTTPQFWDNRYYSEVLNASSSVEIASFESDVNLASPETECGKAFTEFAGDSGEC
jgi:hypothetical protein